MKTIGIDIGTTTISAVVLDTENQNVLEARTITNGSFIQTEQEWERIQDVSVIVSKAQKVLDELLELHPDAQAIGLTCQMHGILYLDEQGNCLSPLYTWQDGRANQTLGEQSGSAWLKGGSTEETYVSYAVRKTKRNAAAGYGLATHFYQVCNQLVPKNSAAICTIGDYLGMVLTGRKKPLIHATNAASLGFYDVKEGHFDQDALEQLGIDTKLLPEVTEQYEVLGTYHGIPISTALGDNQASFLGSVGMQEQVLLVNMGTGGQISVFSHEFFEAEGIEARPFGQGTYLLAGSSLCGGRAYAILEKFFRSYVQALGLEDGSQYDILGKLAQKEAQKRGAAKEQQQEVRKCGTAKEQNCTSGNETADTKKQVCAQDAMQVVTTFHGTRVNPALRGSITNISEDNFTPEGLAYGVLDGMAQELYDMFCLIQNGTGIKAEHIVASGNGLRKNKVLRDIFSHKFQADVTLAQYEEEAACGAAISASLAAKRL